MKAEEIEQVLSEIMRRVESNQSSHVFSQENMAIQPRDGEGVHRVIKNSGCVGEVRIVTRCNSHPVRDFLCPTCRNYTMVPEGISGVKDCEFCGSKVRYSDEKGSVPND